MKLIEYIQDVDFEKIWVELVKYYPDQINSKPGYLKVWKELHELKENTSSSDIFIENVYVPIDEFTDESYYYTVHGKKKGDDTNWAIEYTSWDKWLGMSILEETEKNYTKEFNIAHFLWEMTWSGFSQESIQKRADSIFSLGNDCMEAFKKFKGSDNLLDLVRKNKSIKNRRK